MDWKSMDLIVVEPSSRGYVAPQVRARSGGDNKRKERRAGAALFPGAGGSGAAGSALSGTAAAGARIGSHVAKRGLLGSIGSTFRFVQALPPGVRAALTVLLPVLKGLLLGVGLAGSAYLVTRLGEMAAGANASKSRFAFPTRRSSAFLGRGLPKEPSDRVLARNHMLVKAQPLSELRDAPSSDTGTGTDADPAIEDMLEQADFEDEADAEVEQAENALFSKLAQQLGGLQPGKGIPGVLGGQGAAAGAMKVVDLAAGERIAAAGGMLRPFDRGMSHQQRRMRPVTTQRRHRVTRRRGSRLRAVSSRAMGQLRFANYMSGSGAAAASNDESSAMADAAFNQNQPIGSGLGTSAGGQGSPALLRNAGSTGTGSAPSTGNGENVTPYQQDLDNANATNQQADSNVDSGQNLQTIGLILAAIGLALIYVGWQVGGWWGAIIAAIGAIILALGLYIYSMGQQQEQTGQNQATQASQTGQNISNQYGQNEQGQIVQSQSQAAYNGSLESWQAQDVTVQQGTVQQDAAAESNSTYTMR